MLRRSILAAPALLAFPAHAQWAPTRPLRLVIPFPPGGTTDLVGRMVAERLAHAPLSPPLSPPLSAPLSAPISAA